MDDQYYLRRMSDILQDGFQPRPSFPTNPTRLSRHVIIGNQHNAEDLDTLEQLKVSHILCCSFTRRSYYCPYPAELNLAYKCLPTEDREDFNIAAYFPEAFAFIKSAKERPGGRALVHCNMGVNRSGAIAAAYLMIDERRPLLSTIAYLKYKRRVILTNRGFRRQLIHFARDNNLLDPAPVEIPRAVRRVKVEYHGTLPLPSRRVERVSKKNDLTYELSGEDGGVGCGRADSEENKFENLGYANQNIRPRNCFKENGRIFADANQNKIAAVTAKSNDPIRRKTTDTFTLELIPLVHHKKSLPLSDLDRFSTPQKFEHPDQSNLQSPPRFTARLLASNFTSSAGRTRLVRRFSKDNASAVSDGELVSREYSPVRRSRTKNAHLSSDDHAIKLINYKTITLNDSAQTAKAISPTKDAYFFKDAYLYKDSYLCKDANLFKDTYLLKDAYLFKDAYSSKDAYFSKEEPKRPLANAVETNHIAYSKSLANTPRLQLKFQQKSMEDHHGNAKRDDRKVVKSQDEAVKEANGATRKATASVNICNYNDAGVNDEAKNCSNKGLCIYRN